MRTPKLWKRSHTNIVLVVVTLAALTGPPALAGAASSTGDTSAPAKGEALPHPAPPIYSPPRSEPRTQLGNFLPSSPPKPAVTQAAGSPIPGSASGGTSSPQPKVATTSGNALPTAAPSSSIPPNPLGGRSPTATEIVPARTANSRSYDNHNGTTTTVFASNLNYLASPGNWQPVDLSFRPAGTGFVEDHSAATVQVTAAGIESTDPRSRAGIRFATPALPTVSGHAATAVLDGTSWVFQPTGQGVDFSTIVNSRRGAATYAFPYQLLGRAGPLSVDAQGNLVSSDLGISRASVVGSDGRPYLAGSWRLLPGDVAAFSFDDSALPDSAFPYLLDPAQTGVWTSNYGSAASYLESGTAYPPQAPVQSFDGSSWILAADDNNKDGTYSVADAAVYWTTTLDNRAVTVSGSLYLASCVVAHDDNESLYAEWVTGQNNDSGLYPPSSSTNALTAVPLSTFSNANPNPTACIQGTSTEAQVYNLPMSTLSGFVHYASNGIRFRVGNQAAWPSSSAPSGSNFVYFAGRLNGANQPPLLSITYYYPAPAPTQASPAPGATGVSLTPTLAVNSETDLDGDPVSYRYAVATDPAGSNQVWSTGWGSSTSATVPSNAGLTWNTTYYWAACAWDGLDPNGSSGAPYGGACSGWSGFTTVNAVPPTPGLVSPANGVTLTSTTPTFTVTSVTDPDGDPVSYWFRVATGADGLSGDLVESGWVTSTSWAPPPGSLVDGQSYTWVAQAEDNRGGVSAWSAPWSFHVDLRLGSRPSFAQDALGPISVNLANGNAMASYSSPALTTVGGPIGVSFAYNSDQPGSGGLTASYYNDPNHQRSFGTYQPAVVRTDPNIDFVWGTASTPMAPDPALATGGSNGTSWYLVRWKGSIEVPPGAVTGTASYSFGTVSHDGVQVWVNGTELINNWSDQAAGSSPTFSTSTVSLAPGTPVPIEVDYYDAATAGGQMQLYVQGPLGPGGAPLAVIVPANWFPSTMAALPDGWRFTGDPTGGNLLYSSAAITPGSVVLADPSGATHIYTRSGAGFLPPPGEDSVVTLSGAGMLTVQGDDGSTYNFDPNGTLVSVTSVADDLKPASPIDTWSGTPSRLTAITDPVSGWAIALTYGGPQASCPTGQGFDGTSPNPAIAVGMLCKIDYSAFGRGVTNLYYVNGHLARIEDPGDPSTIPKTDFGYDTSGRLVSVRDVLANDLIAAGTIVSSTAHMTLVGYDASGRVSQTTAPVPDDNGSPRPTHTYGYAADTTYATVSVAGTAQPNGYTRKVTIDPGSAAVTSDIDAAGDTTTYVWQGDLLVRTVDPKGLQTTTIYDRAGHPSDTYGPGTPQEFLSDNTSTTAPHTHTGYDENITGLAATYWDNASMAGAPAAHATGVGDPSGALDAAWGTTPPPGVTTTAWSAMFTGVVRATGTYSFAVSGTGTTTLLINDAPVNGPVTLSASAPARVQLDYTAPGGSASVGLDWTPQGGSQTLVPGSVLDPDYGLGTSHTDADGKATTTQYSETGVGPEVGLATASAVDPGGLALASSTTYEPKGTGYYRVLNKTIPAGGSSAVTDTYYGVTETAVANNCTSASVNQAGALKTETSAGPNPIVHAFVYDASGRVVATEVVGDPAWTCTTYDTRGRVSTHTDSAGNKTTYDYSTPGVAVTSFPDSSGKNRSTTTKLDWVGRSIAYTDEQGTITRGAYDQAGRVTATYRTLLLGLESQLTAVAYDNASRVLSITDYSASGNPATGFGYDADGALTSITRPNGVVTTNNLDAARNWVNSISNVKAGVDLAPWSYSHSLAGRITSETGAGVTDTYSYDGAARLVGVTETAGSATKTRRYAYDANSNRCSTASSTCDGTYTYSAGDQLQASPFAAGYTYDGHGNLVSANPTTAPVPGSVNQAATLSAFAVTPTETVPIGSGAGPLTAGVSWAPAAVNRTGVGSQLLGPGATASTAVPVDGESAVSSTLTWNQGSHLVSSGFSGSVSPGGASSQTVTATASGTVSASLDWSPSTTTGSWSGSVAALGTSSRSITVNASGPLSASVSWPSTFPEPVIGVELIDSATGSVLADSGATLSGTSASFSYSVPASVSYATPKTYSLEVYSDSTGTSYTLTSTYPVTANLGLQILAGSSLVASSSAAAKPQVVTATAQPAGVYTVKVVSNDYAAAYSLTATYPVLAYASLTMTLKDTSGNVVGTVASSSGSSALGPVHVSTGGTYTLTIQNTSPDLAAPATTLSWAGTTLGHDTVTGSIAAGGSTSHSITADGSGYTSPALTWSQGSHPVSSSFSGSVSPGGTSSQTVTATASGTMSASLDWSPATTTGTWSGSTTTLNCVYQPITVSASGPLSATVSWPYSTLSDPTIALDLYDQSGNLLAGSGAVVQGSSASLSYSVPSSVSYASPANYRLCVYDYTYSTTYSLTSTYPVTANLGLQIWAGSTMVASTSAAAKPQAVNATAQPAGVYTIKVVSNDYAAAYSLTATYPVLAYASLTLALTDTSGHVLATTSSGSGSASLVSSVPAAGTYAVSITDASPDIAVPFFSLDTTLPKAHAASASLTLKDASGNTLTTATGPSPLSLTQTVVAGVYDLVVSAVTGTVTTLLTGTYAGRQPKEIIHYDANDHAISIDDGTNTTAETLAPSGRVLERVVTDDMLGTVAEDTLYGYDGPGDSPAYARSGLLGLALTTYVSGPGGLLAIDSNATTSYPIANLHGDIVGTTDTSGSLTTNPRVDEFGVGTSASDKLGYLGEQERFSTGGSLGLVRMGLRLYDPNLGRFLEVDPVEGGCSNSYAYVHGDPVDQFDPSGAVQPCNGAIDATGTGGAGIARLHAVGGGYYQFTLQLNPWFLASHPGYFSFGYDVRYAVNGHKASGQFAGDASVRPATNIIHSRQRIQGRPYSKTGWLDVKTFRIRTGDILYLHIWDYLFDPLNGDIVTVSGSITCRV